MTLHIIIVIIIVVKDEVDDEADETSTNVVALVASSTLMRQTSRLLFCPVYLMSVVMTKEFKSEQNKVECMKSLH